MSVATARVHINNALVFQGSVRADTPFSVTAHETDGERPDAELGIAWLPEEEQKEHAAELEALRRMPREALGLEAPSPRARKGELHLVLQMIAPDLENSKVLRFRSGDKLRIRLDR